MDARNNIATDLFYKIRSRFTGLKLGADTGVITINPEEARFFDFDYMEGNTAIGHVSISLAENNSIKVYFSHGITEAMDGQQKDNWYGFLKELRMFAKRRLLSFDTRDIAKDNLDKRDYAFLSQYANPTSNTQQPVGESIMSESSLYGTKNVSYQKLMDTRLIIKHNQTLADDIAPGARSRNISALFVENSAGERFKYPFIHLSGARAMQRHVANGGAPYDDMGKSIIGMSEEIAQLKSFGNYVVRNDLMNLNTNGIVERSTAQLGNLREQLSKLAKQKYYEAYKESFQAQGPTEIPQSVVEEYTEKFTVKNFKEDIASVFPIIYRLMKESELGYDNIVAMTSDEMAVEDISSTYEDPFSKFEQWAMELGEDGAIQSQDPEAQATALQTLQGLVGQAFPAGVDGSNAIESLKGIIDDPQLEQEIKAQSKENPDVDVRGLIQQWLGLYAPEALEQLDFANQDSEEGPTDQDTDAASDAASTDQDTEEVPAEKPSEDIDRMRNLAGLGEAPDSEEDNDTVEKDKNGNVKSWQHSGEWEKDTDRDPRGVVTHASDDARRKTEKMSKSVPVQELAEFIHTFYDRENGTFPKGPEGVAVMVGKKFGEQAEQVARKMVERMAPQQATEQNPELQELMRIKQLSGY